MDSRRGEFEIRKMKIDEKDQLELRRLRNSIRELDNNIAAHERSFDGLERERRELERRIYRMTDELIEQRTEFGPSPLLLQNDTELAPLFTENIDPFALTLSRHIVLFCLREHSENVHYPHGKEFDLIGQVGRAVIITGHKLREVFKYYIGECYPWQCLRLKNHSAFLCTYMRELHHSFYVHHAGHVPFLILAAFAMEVIYYVMKQDTLRQEYIRLTVCTLASVLSSDEFEVSCGIETFILYAISVSKGYNTGHTSDEYSQLLFEDIGYMPKVPDYFLKDEDEYSVSIALEDEHNSAEIESTGNEELSRYPAGYSASDERSSTASPPLPPAPPSPEPSSCCIALRMPGK